MKHKDLSSTKSEDDNFLHPSNEKSGLEDLIATRKMDGECSKGRARKKDDRRSGIMTK